MENKTISYLNSRVWYRILKVFYLLVLTISIIASFIFFIQNKDIDKENSKIICQKGNKKEFYYKDVSNALIDICEIPTGMIMEPEASGSFKGFVLDPYRFEYKYKINYNYLILSISIQLLLFELVRRIFYYIALGTLRPK